MTGGSSSLNVCSFNFQFKPSTITQFRSSYTELTMPCLPLSAPLTISTRSPRKKLHFSGKTKMRAKNLIIMKSSLHSCIFFCSIYRVVPRIPVEIDGPDDYPPRIHVSMVDVWRNGNASFLLFLVNTVDCLLVFAIRSKKRRNIALDSWVAKWRAKQRGFVTWRIARRIYDFGRFEYFSVDLLTTPGTNSHRARDKICVKRILLHQNTPNIL